ncbi:MAG: BrnA antitoxin family protein [Bdellovibrionales bacterium]|nr:BrnA antitoxin family protein [Bdellovibrionales bacterium]
MKQPKMSDLKVDVVGTRRMRKQMAKAKKVKITINLDSDLLEVLREMAEERGAPYQSLINRILRQVAMERKTLEDTRLEKLERELALLKKKIA